MNSKVYHLIWYIVRILTSLFPIIFTMVWPLSQKYIQQDHQPATLSGCQGREAHGEGRWESVGRQTGAPEGCGSYGWLILSVCFCIELFCSAKKINAPNFWWDNLDKNRTQVTGPKQTNMCTQALLNVVVHASLLVLTLFTRAFSLRVSSWSPDQHPGGSLLGKLRNENHSKCCMWPVCSPSTSWRLIYFFVAYSFRCFHCMLYGSLGFLACHLQLKNWISNLSC